MGTKKVKIGTEYGIGDIVYLIQVYDYHGNKDVHVVKKTIKTVSLIDIGIERGKPVPLKVEYGFGDSKRVDGSSIYATWEEAQRVVDYKYGFYLRAPIRFNIGQTVFQCAYSSDSKTVVVRKVYVVRIETSFGMDSNGKEKTLVNYWVSTDKSSITTGMNCFLVSDRYLYLTEEEANGVATMENEGNV